MPNSGEQNHRLREAVERRRTLLASGETNVCRVVHGEADGFPGVFVDRYGQGATLVRHEGRTELRAEPHLFAKELLRLLAPFGVKAVYDKPFVRDRSKLGGGHDAALKNPTPLAGMPLPVSIVAREHGRAFEIRMYDGFSTGLFLDQRLNRSFLAEKVAGLRVLNTFAYTGGFSVACALGGAITTSVDVSGRYLDWAKRNLALNGIDVGGHHFARMDTFEFLSMAKRKGMTFDLVILDPPTFAAGDKKRGVRPWSAVKDYGRLVSEACGVLADGGRVFASTNAAELCEAGRLREVIRESVGGVKWIEAPEAPEDFVGGRECAKWEAFTISC